MTVSVVACVAADIRWLGLWRKGMLRDMKIAGRFRAAGFRAIDPIADDAGRFMNRVAPVVGSLTAGMKVRPILLYMRSVKACR